MVKKSQEDSLNESLYIVDYCYYVKEEKFVIRFLDGRACSLPISVLPKKYHTKNPNWEESYLHDNNTAILIPASDEDKEIPAHLINTLGEIIE